MFLSVLVHKVGPGVEKSLQMKCTHDSSSRIAFTIYCLVRQINNNRSSDLPSFFIVNIFANFLFAKLSLFSLWLWKCLCSRYVIQLPISPVMMRLESDEKGDKSFSGKPVKYSGNPGYVVGEPLRVGTLKIGHQWKRYPC